MSAGQTFNVKMPDGTVVTGVPAGTTQTELLRRYQKSSQAQAAPADQSLGARISGDLGARAASVKNTIRDLETHKIGPFTGAVQLLGKGVAGPAGDIAGETLSSAGSELTSGLGHALASSPLAGATDVAGRKIRSLLSTSIGKSVMAAIAKGGKEYARVKEEYPQIVKTLESVGDIAQFLPIGAEAKSAVEGVGPVIGKAGRGLTENLSPGREMLDTRLEKAPIAGYMLRRSGDVQARRAAGALQKIAPTTVPVEDVEASGERLMRSVDVGRKKFQAESGKRFSDIYNKVNLKAPVTTNDASTIARTALEKVQGNPAHLKQLDPKVQKWLEQFAPKEYETVTNTTTSGTRNANTSFQKKLRDVADSEIATTYPEEEPPEGVVQKRVRRNIDTTGKVSEGSTSAKNSSEVRRSSVNKKIVGTKSVSMPMDFILDHTKEELWRDYKSTNSPILRNMYHALNGDIETAIKEQSPEVAKQWREANNFHHVEASKFDRLSGFYSKDNKTMASAAEAFKKFRVMVQRGDHPDLRTLKTLKDAVPSTVWENAKGDLLQKMGADETGKFSPKKFVKEVSKITPATRNLLLDKDPVKIKAFDNLQKLAKSFPARASVSSAGSYGDAMTTLGYHAVFHGWFAPDVIASLYGALMYGGARAAEKWPEKFVADLPASVARMSRTNPYLRPALISLMVKAGAKQDEAEQETNTLLGAK